MFKNKNRSLYLFWSQWAKIESISRVSRKLCRHMDAKQYGLLKGLFLSLLFLCRVPEKGGTIIFCLNSSPWQWDKATMEWKRDPQQILPSFSCFHELLCQSAESWHTYHKVHKRMDWLQFWNSWEASAQATQWHNNEMKER